MGRRGGVGKYATTCSSTGPTPSWSTGLCGYPQTSSTSDSFRLASACWCVLCCSCCVSGFHFHHGTLVVFIQTRHLEFMYNAAVDTNFPMCYICVVCGELRRANGSIFTRLFYRAVWEHCRPDVEHISVVRVAPVGPALVPCAAAHINGCTRLYLWHS